MGCDIHFVIERKRKNDAKYIGVYSTCEDIRPLSVNSVEALVNADDKADAYKRWNDDNIPLRNRNYDFFGKLAGVRRDGPEPNGVPEGVSELTQSGLDQWEGDAHSYGHTSLYSFIHTWLSVAYPDKLMLKHAEGETEAQNLVNAIAGPWADVSETNPDVQYRVVYWFDN